MRQRGIELRLATKPFWATAALALALLATGAQAQEWFSGPVPSSRDKAAAESSPVLFDVVVSLHSNPAGDDDGHTQDVDPGSADQDTIEKILQYFADGVYESTEGKHKLRKIRIFRNSARHDKSNIYWRDSGNPEAELNGLTVLGPGNHIFMYDLFGSQNLLTDKIGAGYTLAHEWAHYAYGLRDEYSKDTGDLPVVPSIMNSQWDARGGDQRWLNFSIANQGEPIGDFENTLRTFHHRTYGKSGWEVLATEPDDLEAKSPFLVGKLPRKFYSELAAVAPVGDAEPTIQDLATAPRSDLDIIWMKEDLVYEIVIDRSSSMNSDFKMENARTAAKLLVDLAIEGSSKIGILSFNSTVQTIAEIREIQNATDRDQLKAQIDTITATGSTAIGTAAATALAKLQAPGVEGTKVVFLLSDGQNTAGQDPLSVIPDYLSAQVPLFTFAFGADADTAVLGRLANETHGRLYVSPTTLAAVSQAFQDANAAAGGATGVAAGDKSLPPGGQEESSISVDSTLGSLSLTVNAASDPAEATFELITPNGSNLAPSGTELSGDETLVFFTVKNPAPGTWRLRAKSNGPQIDYSFQASGEQVGASYSLGSYSVLGETLTYPDPLLVVASIAGGRPIGGVLVNATVVAPNGDRSLLTLKDDGVAPDSQANDGKYSALTSPDQNGLWVLEIEAAGEAGVAFETSGGLEASALPGGIAPPAEPDRFLTERFSRFERLRIQVNGAVTDDHGNVASSATPVPIDNGDKTRGKLERSGDVDVFAIRTTTAGELAIRVTDLALGMDPLLRIFAADGSTLLASGVLPANASRSGYLVLRLPVGAGTELFAAVSHLRGGTGLYSFSVGPALDIDQPQNSGPCQPGPQTLCLQGGRFEVEVEWTDFLGQSGTGTAVGLTADTGHFWFFNPSNIELVVKVLDGVPINGNYWVFYGALSNVAYTVNVRDTTSGNIATYINPSGKFESRGDTNALPAATALLPSRRVLVFEGSEAGPKIGTESNPRAACVDGSNAICVNGRYLVQVEFLAHGAGRAERLSSDSAFFWIFDAANVEMVVKVLDGRLINGADWLFYGSLTDQAFQLKVTDTVTGDQRTYTNPQGMLASFGDISAFPRP